MRSNLKLAGMFLLVTALPGAAMAKRKAPEPVKPVTANGVTYSAVGDGKSAYVEATESSTGKQLWKVLVYKVHMDSRMEVDAQYVYITELKIIGNALWVRDEKKRCFELDLTSRKSKPEASPADWPQPGGAD
jgi:hypothetical protein